MTSMVRRLIVEPGAAGYPLARRVERLMAAVPRVAGPSDVKPGPGAPDAMDKETLCLTAFPGELLKPCPGTGEGYICCGYQILNVGTNCPLDCSYCILQAYVNQPSLRLFVNLPEALPRIGRHVDGEPSRIWRIGTGEFTDSLALDPVAGWSRWLPPFVHDHPNVVLELKTKTVEVEGLLDGPLRERMVVAWSLNSPWMVSHEEHRAPGLEARLRAAARCQEAGFALAFHFDPLVRHPGWREGYRRTLDLLARHIAPERVVWVSLGAMRYMPALKAVVRRRHPGSAVLRGEFVPGLDGKMRYFKPLRVDMYGWLRELITAWNPDPGLYLCMESDDAWRDALGWSPGTSSALAGFLDGRAREVFSMLSS